MRRWLITLVGVTLGCPTSEPAEQPRDASPVVEPERLGERPTQPDPEQQRAAAVVELLDTVDALAQIHRAHAGDCSALADAIVTFHGQHGAALTQTPDEVLARIDADEALRVRLRTAMETIMSAAMGCRDSSEFSAAQARLVQRSDTQ